MEGTIAEIRLFAANFEPRNWAYCRGQLIAIQQNNALFSLLGTTYGGNGIQTFGLPNLASRIARGAGNGAGLSPVQLGEMSGSPSVTLNSLNLPAHTHTSVLTYSSSSSGNNPASSQFGPIQIRVSAPPGVNASANAYGTTTNAVSNPQAVGVAVSGGSQPVPVQNPYLGMNYIICLYGIYPSRN